FAIIMWREASRHMMMANAIDPDPCASMAAQTAALLALRARQVTGQGQQVFASMLSANQYANSDDALSYAGKADRLIIDGQVLGTSALRRLYEAGGGWICISAESDDHFTKLCNASGRTDLLNDARFATAAARGKHDAELISALEALFATESASHWERSLIAAGVGCVEANNDESSAAFWLEDEQVKANDLAPTARHMILGEYQRWGALVSFEKNQCTLGGGVIAGEHTDELLAELGFSTESIADLRARKIVWSDDNLPPLAE
ncbi:MAG: CoA transferase, partial [Chloroflexota bacterium]